MSFVPFVSFVLVSSLCLCGRLNRGEAFGPDVLLTVSLTRPYAGSPGKPPLCYKVAAAVIEM